MASGRLRQAANFRRYGRRARPSTRKTMPCRLTIRRRWHGMCTIFLALPPTHGVCEHVDSRNSGAGSASVGGRTTAGRGEVFLQGRGWRPAVVGTGGIQEDRVPGARTGRTPQIAQATAAFSFVCAAQEYPSPALGNCEHSLRSVSGAPYGSRCPSCQETTIVVNTMS